MLRGKQILLNLLAFLFFGAAFYFVSNNFDPFVSFKLFSLSFENISMGWPMLISALLMGVAVFLKMLAQMTTGQSQTQKAERQREKAQVSVEESSGKVKALESKVETLEKALEKALEASSR